MTEKYTLKEIQWVLKQYEKQFHSPKLLKRELKLAKEMSRDGEPYDLVSADEVKELREWKNRVITYLGNEEMYDFYDWMKEKYGEE